MCSLILVVGQAGVKLILSLVGSPALEMRHTVRHDVVSCVEHECSAALKAAQPRHVAAPGDSFAGSNCRDPVLQLGTVHASRKPAAIVAGQVWSVDAQTQFVDGEGLFGSRREWC